MTITYGTPSTATSPVSQITVNLATTTVGELNLIAVSVHSTPGHAGVQPVVATPDGWTLVGDSWKSGTPSHEVAWFWRVYQSGDGSTVDVSWGTGTNQPGGATALSAGLSTDLFDASTPIASGEASTTQSAGPTTNVTDSLTLAGDRLVFSLFANRSGATWSAASDGNIHDAIGAQTRISGSASIAICCSGTATSNGGARSLLSSASTSINNVGVVAIQAPAASSAEGTATGSFSWAGAATGHAVRGVDAWIADRPMYVAHRGGSADWPEMTMYAYEQAAAWHPGIGLNIDVVPTSDGVWVGSHDLTTGRVFGAGNNYTIHSTTWSTLSALRTTVGNQPMARLDDFLDTYGGDPDQPVFIDNKYGDQTTLLDWLDSNYSGWQEWVIWKGYCNPGQTPMLQAAKARGARTWPYMYETDMVSGTSNDGQVHPTATDLAMATMFGLNYDASSGAWDTLLATGKPVLAHIVASSGNKSSADTNSGGDLAGYMVSGVEEVIPQTGGASGTATGTFGWAGSATGHTVHSGTGVGSFGWAGSATGHTAHGGAAAGGYGWDGTAAGHANHSGTAVGTFAWAGTADGSTTHQGTATGTFGWGGAATGHAPTVGEQHGTATGFYGWAGVATGHAPDVPAHTGSAAGLFGWAGVATGHAPAEGEHHGTAAGLFGWAGTATGSTTRTGSAAGVYGWVGAATGHNGTVITVTPPERTYTVAAENRTFTVAAEIRETVA